MIHTRRLALDCAALLALLGISCVADGQALPDAVQACKREADDSRRLACFDREVAKFPLSAAQAFGLNSAQVATVQREETHAEPPVRILAATVTGLRERPHAGYVVTLDNGQVWEQNQAEPTRGVHVGDAVTIKPGALGSFWLIGPTGLATKAHRVQ